MSLVRRMKDMTRATLNEMLEKTEDPIRCIDRYLAEQKEHLYELEKLLHEQLRHVHALRRQVLEADQAAAKREEQAALALKAGEEEVARMALQDKIAHEEKRDQYKKWYDQGKEAVAELENCLEELKADVREVMEKRQVYLARMQSLQLQQRMAEHRSRRSGHPDAWFHRLEDLISDLEIETTAWRDVVYGTNGDPFRKGRQSAVDREMEKLREKINHS